MTSISIEKSIETVVSPKKVLGIVLKLIFLVSSLHYSICLGSIIFKKYKTFSVLIYSYINMSGNWKNEKLCGKTRNCVETRRPQGGVFSHNFEFFQFS